MPSQAEGGTTTATATASRRRAGRSALKIKTGVVERTAKELASYQAEERANRAAVARVRAGDDHSRLRQWEGVLAETQAMIPDTAHRLSRAVADLSASLAHAGGDDAEVAAARAAVDAASTALAECA